MRSRCTTAPRSRNGSTLLADIQIIGPALKRALGSSLQFTSVGAAVVAGTILACGAATGHHADGALEMFYWIYDYPTGCMGALFAFVFVATTCLGIFLLRPIVRSWAHSERRANDMVGFILSSFSVLYGLLLGLLAVATYQNFSSVNDIVTKEASSLAALYRDLGGYPQPICGSLRDKLREYTRYVIEDSWPQQRRGIVPSGGS